MAWRRPHRVIYKAEMVQLSGTNLVTTAGS